MRRNADGSKALMLTFTLELILALKFANFLQLPDALPIHGAMVHEESVFISNFCRPDRIGSGQGDGSTAAAYTRTGGRELDRPVCINLNDNPTR